MTRYDPFSYGEVPLDSKQPGDAAPDAEDLLFAAGEQNSQAPPADDSWSLLEDNVDGLMPGETASTAETIAFGTEVLGEDAGDGAAMHDPLTGGEAMSLEDLQDASPPSAGMGQQVGQQMAQPMDQPSEPAMVEPQAAPTGDGEPSTPRGRAVRRQPLAPRAAAQPGSEPEAPQQKQFAAVPPRRGLPILAAFLPIALCAGGGTAASWFWVMQNNPVMAGILGATTLVSALFAWLLLRG